MAKTVLRISTAALCLYLATAADFTFDAKSNTLTGLEDGSGFEVVKEFEGGSDTECSRHGVIKLTFDRKTRKWAEMKLFFDADETNVSYYTFDLGDSDTNFGGYDAGSQSNKAEVYSTDRKLSIYGRQDYGLLYERDEFMKGNISVNVSNMLFEATNGPVGDPGASIIHYHSKELFALNGQKDSVGEVNYDLYLGINRVIHPNVSREGKGLCRVEITWHQKM